MITTHYIALRIFGEDDGTPTPTPTPTPTASSRVFRIGARPAIGARR